MELQYLLFQIVVVTLSPSIKQGAWIHDHLHTHSSSCLPWLPASLSFSSLRLSVLSGTGPMGPLQPESKVRLFGKEQLGDHG